MSLTKAQFGNLAAVTGLAVLVISWSARADITASFQQNAGISIPSTLAGMGILVVLVERATEVVVNTVRTEAKAMQARLDQFKHQSSDQSEEYKLLADRLVMYKSGTQRFSLLVGLAIGISLACTGVGFLNSILNAEKSIPIYLQLRRGVDILLTAGFLAGGSQALHENVANKIRDAVTPGFSN